MSPRYDLLVGPLDVDLGQAAVLDQRHAQLLAVVGDEDDLALGLLGDDARPALRRLDGDAVPRPLPSSWRTMALGRRWSRGRRDLVSASRAWPPRLRGLAPASRPAAVAGLRARPRRRPCRACRVRRVAPRRRRLAPPRRRAGGVVVAGSARPLRRRRGGSRLRPRLAATLRRPPAAPPASARRRPPRPRARPLRARSRRSCGAGGRRGCRGGGAWRGVSRRLVAPASLPARRLGGLGARGRGRRRLGAAPPAAAPPLRGRRGRGRRAVGAPSRPRRAGGRPALVVARPLAGAGARLAAAGGVRLPRRAAPSPERRRSRGSPAAAAATGISGAVGRPRAPRAGRGGVAVAAGVDPGRPAAPRRGCLPSSRPPAALCRRPPRLPRRRVGAASSPAVRSPAAGLPAPPVALGGRRRRLVAGRALLRCRSRAHTPSAAARLRRGKPSSR